MKEKMDRRAAIERGKMKKYRVILFDADGTLFDYDEAESYALESSFRHFHLPYDRARHLGQYRAINNKMWKELEQGRISSEKLRIERFKLLFNELGEVNELDENVDFSEFSQAYLQFLAQGVKTMDGACAVCRYLAPHYTLAIITNGIKDVQTSRLFNSELKKYVRHIIISEEAGYQKPHPGIFDFASQVTGEQLKGHALIVGDSLSADILGGINYGIDTCWYNPSGLANRTKIVPQREIRQLLELKNFL